MTSSLTGSLGSVGNGESAPGLTGGVPGNRECLGVWLHRVLVRFAVCFFKGGSFPAEGGWGVCEEGVELYHGLHV